MLRTEGFFPYTHSHAWGRVTRCCCCVTLGVEQGCFCMVLLLCKVFEPSLCVEDAVLTLQQTYNICLTRAECKH